ncbi:class III signal peptide-containing protein [Methanobacterium sp. ACI-7]|uniref:class III signal peptide-containing protein n=1 Tax=unclassified Methanobacterium TaxID=2627676 RepID=UPI0039C00C22
MFLNDERGQGAAEYILLFGGVIVIAIAALLIYQSYFKSTPMFTQNDLQSVRSNVSAARNGT